MPFPMVHLRIAWNILNATAGITQPHQFLLGAIAPDSVHFRPGYTSRMKTASHLCVGGEPWGYVTNDGEWRANVLRFLACSGRAGETDFLLGYCSHILGDIRNNIVIWTPFRRECSDEPGKGLNSAYHRQAARVDRELYRAFRERDALWELLERSRAIGLEGMVNAAEIEAMKHHLLHRQYAEDAPEGHEELPESQYVTVQGMTEFIARESEHIRGLLDRAVL